jgi:uncharacterized protein YigE (DUF2233 family)
MIVIQGNINLNKKFNMKYCINILFLIFFTISPAVVFAQHFVFKPSQLRLFWKDARGIPFLSFSNVRKEHPNLVFMMNAGMYTASNNPAPVGLYVENGVKLCPVNIVINKKVNYGISPSGIFYFNAQKAHIIKAKDWSNQINAKYATQSGPMLLIEGVVNRNLPKGSYIKRNGVGVRADGKVVFACFRSNFIDFAVWFKNQKCTNALYLDGGISDYWTPNTLFSIGKFGPIIGAVE